MGSILLAVLLASAAQIDVAPPDPPTSAPAEDPASANLAKPDAAPSEAPALHEAQEPPIAATQPGSAPARSNPADAAPETPPTEPSPAVTPRSLTALPELPATPACPQPEPAGPTRPCETGELASNLSYGGLGIAAAGLLGAVGFAVATLVERDQAQSLLDGSPAFGQIGERYVVRDAQHPDVEAYEGHRSTASVLAQLGWIGVGVGLSGAAVAATATLLGAQAELCIAPPTP